MPQPHTGTVPHLVVFAPDRYRGRRIELSKEYLVVGRGDTCDVCFDDPHVSRTHAALRWREDTLYVQDLGSSAGTSVNGISAGTERALRPGDVVSFATVKARLGVDDQATGTASAETTTVEATTPVHHDIGQQQGGIISNVGHDQYNSYVQHVYQQRESFLREIAATRTKARWLILTGFLAFVVGFGLFAAPVLGFLKQGADAIESGDVGPPADPFGVDIAGIPSGLLGWAIAALGVFLVIIGAALHVVASSRRRRVDRDLPVLPPRERPGQWGG